jgi:hypothetical protein
MERTVEYFFMLTNNPSYRYFTIKYYTEAGIEYVDEYMGAERAQAICREIHLKKEKTQAEIDFCIYVGRENADPQRQLADITTLEMTHGRITAAKMRRLEAQLPEGHRTNLVLTKEEVALKIFDFYNGPLRMEFTDDLKNPDPRNIYNHIQPYDEDTKLPEFRVVGRVKFEAAARAFVEKLQLWVNEATPEAVLGDIDRVLDEHFWTPSDRPQIIRGTKEESVTCHHDSKYVQMTGHPQNIGFPLHLWPSRAPVYDERHEGPEVEVPVFQVEANLPRRAELTR